MKYWHRGVAVLALLVCAGFTADSAGRACVQEKGERGVAYDVSKTKMKDAYTPNGRRMLEDGQRVYEIEVPSLMKRDKPVICTMSLATGMWKTPGPDYFARNPFATGASRFGTRERERPETDPDVIVREMRERDSR
jgi:hypothetical protein